MKLVLSGEGKTDMGQMAPGAVGPEYVPGPMAYLVDRLLEPRLGYSLLETQAAGGECVRFVDEAELGERGKSGPNLLPGLKFGKGQAFFARNAQVLGLLAKEEQARSGDSVVAVLFRDADSTRSTPASAWREKVESMRRGFTLAEFPAGTPMVPRPKSEAWLLCALKDQPYADCEALEDAPGNDGSERSLKGRLSGLIGHEPSAEEQADWVRDGRVDPERIDMPSFVAFRDALTTALNTARSARRGAAP